MAALAILLVVGAAIAGIVAGDRSPSLSSVATSPGTQYPSGSSTGTPPTASQALPDYQDPGVTLNPPGSESLTGSVSTLTAQWSNDYGNGYSLQVVPGGVNFSLSDSGDAQSYSLPSDATAPTGPLGSTVETRGDVRFVSGGTGNALGLGCRDLNGVDFWFFIHDDGVWSFDTLDDNSSSAQVMLLVRNSSAAIRPTAGVNQLSVLCSATSGGQAQFELVANGTPVANLTYADANSEWTPIIAMCSPDGPDTGQFTDVSALYEGNG